ncbi:phage holin family protein [Methylophaga pinxianii]|uniref:phage holin family protein n=1 Tax=Methylophaga pinxianii TaxID=2881052 RepID=UPI001CF56B6D|nr:phage holin family protein [Methylophaga pinxianii]MCB2426728.1 phage holin family protein [Methylophaga pinxianii]UPH45819.1 phage holin family protein [Methylophaga pinxianii]
MKKEQQKPTSVAAESSHNNGSESIADLIRDLARDLSTLLSKEVALAKAEVRESVSDMNKAVGAIATGAVLAMAGVVVLLMSGVYGLSNVVEPWLAALIVGALALLIGFLMVNSAKKKMSARTMVPDRTMDSAKKDKETLERAVR